MSSSRSVARESHGFTLIELLVALTLALLLAMACASLWLSVQRVAVESADRIVWTVQARVASTRLERDLRLAGVGLDGAAAGLGTLTGPILAADERGLVVVTRSSSDGAPELVQWELVGKALMRRRGPWAGEPIAAPTARSLYSDHKTMLEGLASTSHFAFGRNAVSDPSPESGVPAAPSDPVDPAGLRWIESVSWIAQRADPGDGSPRGTPTSARLWLAR